MGRITKRNLRWKLRAPSLTTEYERFYELNGLHSWQSAMPGSFVFYPVRKLQAGRVLYFNFDLAKEMGLLPAHHSNQMNKNLEQTILDTFSIRILNEYDQKQNVRYLPHVLKPHPYMATRYLQMQHSNKRGTTSGDGRSIWNGEIEHAGIKWDVSSRGTGVTRLAPGVVEANKPLRSGSTEFGYGCGLADVDELIGAAILSEIFHRNGVGTERVLAVIDIGSGNGIGVRAAPNLMRPAHIFMHLKQGQYEALRRSVDYFIDRQHVNGAYRFSSKSQGRYRLLLSEVARTFARFAAQLDREYIFAWLDWDGDNVLADGGIIDYGSIRQFGLRHDEYRYDDVERYSTTLNEQRLKARAIVQTFAQAAEFLTSKKKRPIQYFQSHWSVRVFDREFDKNQKQLFLQQLGFSEALAGRVYQEKRKLVSDLYSSYLQLESTKTQRKIQKVPDGLNRPAILNMRRTVAEMAKLAKEKTPVSMTARQFFNLALADSAKGRDRKPTRAVLANIRKFQELYAQLLELTIKSTRGKNSFLKDLFEISKLRYRPNRMTGDALLYVVDEILTSLRKKKAKIQDVQVSIERLIAEQSPIKTPARHTRSANARHSKRSPEDANREGGVGDLYQTLLRLIDGHKESI